MPAGLNRPGLRASVEVACVFVALPASVWCLRAAVSRFAAQPLAGVAASMALAAIALALTRHGGRDDFTALWQKRRRMLRTAGLSVAASCAALVLANPSLQAPLGRLGVIWVLAAVEEVVFRVVVPSRLACLLSTACGRPRVARFVGVVLAQVAFALCHTPLAWPALLRLFAAGALYAMLVRRALWAAIATHAALNAELQFGSDLALPTDWVGSVAFAGAALAWLACDVWSRPPSDTTALGEQEPQAMTDSRCVSEQ